VGATAHASELSGMAVPDAQSCLMAIAKIERTTQLPHALLHAIGMVESGHFDPKTGLSAPWPWSINVEGTDHIFATKAEAIMAVRQAQAIGVQSIDVGCMQINLKHHPNAFVTLDEAFDPETNVTYAAGFLARLHGEVGDWPAAAGAYHSQTPSLSDAYVARVAVYWSPAQNYVAKTAAARAPLVADVDPYNVMTPEEKARMTLAAHDRAIRDAAIGPETLPIPKPIVRLGTPTIGVYSGLLPIRAARLDQHAQAAVTRHW
jgi:hypothetical protein